MKEKSINAAILAAILIVGLGVYALSGFIGTVIYIAVVVILFARSFSIEMMEQMAKYLITVVAKLTLAAFPGLRFWRDTSR